MSDIPKIKIDHFPLSAPSPEELLKHREGVNKNKNNQYHADVELLTYAAIAAGYDLGSELDCAESGIFIGKGCDGEPMYIWNPLENDADAFRLMVKIDLAVHCDAEWVQSWHSHDVCGSCAFAEVGVENAGGTCEAVRRSIVLSAAEIGKMG